MSEKQIDVPIFERLAHKQKRGKIKTSLVNQLKQNGTYKEPYIDLVEQYLNMWDISQALDEDVKMRGVTILTNTGLKKNDSVSQLTNINKQMTVLLDKLQLQAKPEKRDDGEDI